jgi:hypothetical protein
MRATFPDPQSKRCRELSAIEKTCLHNANVCKSFDEEGKQQTWELLAKAVTRQMEASPPAGDPLGEQLVSNLLRYYESLRDVQMLSVIVCVLRGTGGNLFLLPRDEDHKFDTYIRRVSTIMTWYFLVGVQQSI